MKKEPVVISQIIGVILAAAVVLYPPIHQPIMEAGGEQAVIAAVGTIIGLVTAIMRSRVTPV